MSLSQASPAWARRTLPSPIDGIPVHHVSWKDIQDIVVDARDHAHGAERLWLNEFQNYLRKAAPMTDPADGWTYCVVVSDDVPNNQGSKTFGTMYFTRTPTSILSAGAMAGRKLLRTSSRSGGATRCKGFTA